MKVEENCFRSLSWSSYKTGGATAELLASNVALQGLETEFFCWNAK
jgi:hypothetical protein